MRTNWATFPIEVKGGLITNLSPLQQGATSPGSAVVLSNFEASVDGGYKKILGYSRWSEEKVPGDTIIQGVVSLSSENALAVSGGKYYFSEAKGAWTLKLDSSGSPGVRVRHVTYNFSGTEKTVMVNGATKPVFWDSVAETIAIDAAAPTDVEAATYVIEFKNHLFFGKGTNIAFTAPFTDDDYATINGAGVVNVGSTITGLAVFREELIIFSEDRINRLVGSSSADFVMKPITLKTGCINGDTIQEVGGDILYLGPDGVRYLSATDRVGDFALARASEQIQSVVTNHFHSSDIYSSTVVRKKAQYRLYEWQEAEPNSLSRGLIGTRFLDQQSTGISWSLTFGIKPYTSDSKQHVNTETIIFSSSATVGGSYVYEMESGNSFDGEVIPCQWRTPQMPLTDPQIRKTFYKVTVYLETENNFELTCQPSLKGDTTGFITPPPIIFTPSSVSTIYFWGDAAMEWGTFTWGAELDQVYKDNMIGSGFTVSLDFIESSATASFSLDTILLEYRQNDRK